MLVGTITIDSKTRGVMMMYSDVLEQKAKKGDAQAQLNLGVCYERGRGITKDEKVAVSWYHKAAEGAMLLLKLSWVIVI